MCNLVPSRKEEDGYFCSEFVAVMLQRLKIMNNKIDDVLELTREISLQDSEEDIDFSDDDEEEEEE